ncbi:MAG: hypothetical protein JW857_11120 [Bacteroidales bacterium]|nr:hypothetical protein [Bacteroidales bacterium]
MKRILLVVVLITFSLATTFAQTSNEPITMQKTFGSYQFYQGPQKLKMRQLVKTMKINEQAYKEIRSARRLNNLTSVIGFIGGSLIGYQTGYAITGGKPDVLVAGIGLALIGVSIPINKQTGKKASKAVNTYNEGLHTSNSWDKKELRLNVSENGLGLALSF